LSRISGIMLAAPDIDPDVFESQVDDISPLPKPFTVIVSRRDRVLRISRLIAGVGDRVGRGSDIAIFQERDIQVIDISAIDGGTHTAFAGSGTLIQLLNSDQFLREMITNESAPKNAGLLRVGQSMVENTAL